MKRKDIGFLIAMVLAVIISWSTNIDALAFSKPTEIKAYGRWDHDANNDGKYDNISDVVYDAEDIYYLYELCK